MTLESTIGANNNPRQKCLWLQQERNSWWRRSSLQHFIHASVKTQRFLGRKSPDHFTFHKISRSKPGLPKVGPTSYCKVWFGPHDVSSEKTTICCFILCEVNMLFWYVGPLIIWAWGCKKFVNSANEYYRGPESQVKKLWRTIPVKHLFIYISSIIDIREKTILIKPRKWITKSIRSLLPQYHMILTQ